MTPAKANKDKSTGGKKRPATMMPAGAYTPPPPPDAFGEDAPGKDTRKPSNPPAGDDTAATSDGSILHDLFSQQVCAMLDRTDLDEGAKQGILVAMNCPCCGAGAPSFTAKIRRRR